MIICYSRNLRRQRPCLAGGRRVPLACQARAVREYDSQWNFWRDAALHPMQSLPRTFLRRIVASRRRLGPRDILCRLLHLDHEVYPVYAPRWDRFQMSSYTK